MLLPAVPPPGRVKGFLISARSPTTRYGARLRGSRGVFPLALRRLTLLPSPLSNMCSSAQRWPQAPVMCTSVLHPPTR